MISSPNNKTMIATTITTATNTPVSGVTTNTPKTRQSTPVAPAPAAVPPAVIAHPSKYGIIKNKINQRDFL